MNDENRKKPRRAKPEHELYLPPSRIIGEGGDDEMRRGLRRISRRAFFGFGVSALAGFAGWRWLVTRGNDDGLPWPFRRALESNEGLARDYFSNGHLANTYDKSEASRKPRVNGDLGLTGPFDIALWTLAVTGVDESAIPPPPPPAIDTTASHLLRDTTSTFLDDTLADDVTPADTTSADDLADDEGDDDEPMPVEKNSLKLTMDDLKKLPYVEFTTELRCIEGWNEIVHWGGARMADFMAKYPPMTQSGDDPDVKKKPRDLLPYISMETPDGKYYVGLEVESALHPQTLLCYTMNGKPLTPEHGAPLRLVVPVKYGVKNIKRIGAIRYTSHRPADYWAERGYDWYAGL